jgi:hypothetical protein
MLGKRTMKTSKFRIISLLLIASLISILIAPASSIPEGDVDGPPVIRYEEHSWYHDCSNTTGFRLNNSWDVSWNHGWEPVSGPIVSDGERVFLFTGPADGLEYVWYGPIYMYELPHNFTLRNLISFNIDFEVDNSEEMSRECNVYIHLVDSSYQPLLAFRWTDNWWDGYFIRYSANFWTNTQTRITYTTNPIYNQSYRFQSTIVYDEESGLRFSIPTMENHDLYSPADDDLQRNISHIVLMYGGHSSDIPTRTYLHSISLQYELPITADSPSNNDTSPDSPMEGVQLTQILTWSVSFVSAMVIIVLSSLIIKHPRKSE